MDLKSGGMTETEHMRLERIEGFRAAIIARAEENETNEARSSFEIPKDAQIQLASNRKGAWVDAKIWVEAAFVNFSWLDEVANPPSTAELAEALRVLLREIPSSVPMKIIKGPMDVLARHQGKRSWVDVKL